MASAIHFPGRRKTERGGKSQNVCKGEGKPKIRLQILPTTAWMMHQRQFLQREGRGRVPEAAPRPGARQVLPGGGFSFLLPSSCFFKALQSVPFATDSMGNSSFFLPASPRGLAGGAAGAANAGCGRHRAPGSGSSGYLAARARSMSVVAGRPAGPRRAERPVSSRPHRGRPPRLPTPWRGGAFRDSKDTDGSSCGGGGGARGSSSYFSALFTPLG